MDMVVTTREPVPLRLANNAVDRTYGAAALEGDRIYMRGYYGATCIAYTGDEGRRYEARTVVRNLLDEMHPRRPTDGAVRAIPMAGESALTEYRYGHPRYIYKAPPNCLLLSGQAPHRWWVAGPVPAASAERALAALGAPGKMLRGDEAFRLDGKEYVWGPLCQSFLQVADFKPWELDPANFTDIHRVRRVSDLGKALAGRGRGACFAMTELRSEREQVMRFEQALGGARAWVGGVEVRCGDRVKFGKGVCQLLLQIKLDVPPGARLELSPRFWASEDFAKEDAAWLARAKRIRPYLENVIRLAPNSEEAVEARAVLAAASSPATGGKGTPR
jgi:hypothetical protein